MNYYRQILEFWVEICSVDEFQAERPMKSWSFSGRERRHRKMAGSILIQAEKKGLYHRPMWNSLHPAVLYSFTRSDIVTDLAKDRAKFLNIVFK